LLGQGKRLPEYVTWPGIIIIWRDREGVCNEFDFARKALIIFVLGKNVLII
jgi:hypothetical protein